MGYIADGSRDRRSGDGIKSIANIMLTAHTVMTGGHKDGEEPIFRLPLSSSSLLPICLSQNTHSLTLTADSHDSDSESLSELTGNRTLTHYLPRKMTI